MGILLCPNHLRVTDKIRKKTRKWNGTQESIFFLALSSSIKKEHNYAYSNAFGLRLCSLVAAVSDVLFWIRLFFSHSFIEKFLFYVKCSTAIREEMTWNDVSSLAYCTLNCAGKVRHGLLTVQIIHLGFLWIW